MFNRKKNKPLSLEDMKDKYPVQGKIYQWLIAKSFGIITESTCKETKTTYWGDLNQIEYGNIYRISRIELTGNKLTCFTTQYHGDLSAELNSGIVTLGVIAPLEIVKGFEFFTGIELIDVGGGTDV